jgi:hypothetical protein
MSGVKGKGDLPMRSIRSAVLAAIVCAAVSVVVTPALAAPTSKPPVKVVKRLLTKQYVDNKFADKRERVAWKQIQFGKPRLGTYLSDGVPPNSKTMVYPVRARIVHTRLHSRDNWKTVYWRVVTVYTAEYVFFKNEFGAWTYRVKKQESKVTVNEFNY